jgi:hypothetical protein
MIYETAAGTSVGSFCMVHLPHIVHTRILTFLTGHTYDTRLSF